MEMKNRLPLLLVTFLLVASLAACGGSSSSVPANAVAVVNGVPITTTDFNTFLNVAMAVAQSQGQPKPTPGSPQYIAMRDQVISYLVQYAEVKQQAVKEGVSVSQSDVTKFIQDIVKTKFGGSMAKLTAALKQQGTTMPVAEKEVYLRLLAQKIQTKVTASAAVTAAAVRAYYTQNLSQYTTPESTTRQVRHILVKTRAQAIRLRRQVTNANFGQLAKKNSTDPGSASKGGRMTAVKGQLLKPFEDVAFTLKTGEISAPVHTQAGWHIIQALGPIKTTKGHTSTFAQVQATIKQTLLKQQQDQLFQKWLSDLTKSYAGKVIYQKNYAPATTASLPTTT
jgi:parvulin-like peptidyl-prolyl isomerase